MSLFGSSPPESGLSESANRKSSLFDDDHKAGAKSGTGLFDDETMDGESPWSMPTPKKAARGDLVKSLLPATSVPENYVDAFDVLSNSDYQADGGQVNMEGIRKLLESTRISPDVQTKILNQVTANKTPSSLGRNEFNVLLALVGLVLEGEEATLDSVDERKKSEIETLYLDLEADFCRSSESVPSIHCPIETCQSLRQPRRRLHGTVES